MEPAALTTHCKKFEAMTSLFRSIDQQPQRQTKRISAYSSYSEKSVCSMCAEVWAGNTVHQHILYIGFDTRVCDILCSGAADLQINTFLEALHVTRLGLTYADTTCSYSTSWETLIFNTFSPCNSSELSSLLQFCWFFNLCVDFVKQCQIQRYYWQNKC